MVNVNLKISNKTLYTLITLVICLALIIGVYSYGTSDPVVFGHTPSEIDPGTFAGGGNYIFPSDSKVGIGASPSEELHVEGDAYISGNIHTSGDICIGNCP